MAKYLDENGLNHLIGKIYDDFSTKNEFNEAVLKSQSINGSDIVNMFASLNMNVDLYSGYAPLNTSGENVNSSGIGNWDDTPETTEETIQ